MWIRASVLIFYVWINNHDNIYYSWSKEFSVVFRPLLWSLLAQSQHLNARCSIESGCIVYPGPYKYVDKKWWNQNRFLECLNTANLKIENRHSQYNPPLVVLPGSEEDLCIYKHTGAIWGPVPALVLRTVKGKVLMSSEILTVFSFSHRGYHGS